MIQECSKTSGCKWYNNGINKPNSNTCTSM